MEKAKLESAKPTPEESPGVDLCIMLDCTGSMSSYIEMSKNKIQDIMANVKESYPKSTIRVAIVAYRDHCDSKKHEIRHFTESSEVAKSFLKTLQADGGGDTPEDVNGAFQIALRKLHWQNPVRLLILIADAPCHGKEFHKCDDNHPNGHKSDEKWETIFRELVDLRLDFLFLKITEITDLMFTKFREIAIKCGIEDYDLSFTQEKANKDASNNYKVETKKKTAKVKAVKGKGGKKEKEVEVEEEEEKVAPLREESKEDHFAKIIADKVKSSVGKELKKGFEKKLEKRTTQNGELVENTKKTVASIVQTFDFEELKKKYGDLSSKVGECILSSNNFIEALHDEDCLCLTFNIGRSQAAIVDPSQIIIKDVYPSFLTAGSFFYSTEFALKKNKLAHGGYEKNAEGLIIKGAAQEDITGVMPLYFCEENWKVAKLLMKLTIGWAVTLEPAGYTFPQLTIVPFMILAKLAQLTFEKPESEFLKFQFGLVKETCMQIMKDASRKESERKFDEDVFSLFQKYVGAPSVRTIDVIANNTAFLAQLYIAKENQMMFSTEDAYFDDFVKALIEEEIRRKLYPLEESINTNVWLLELLNVDIKTLIEAPVNKYRDSHKVGNPIYVDDFLYELEKVEVVQKEERRIKEAKEKEAKEKEAKEKEAKEKEAKIEEVKSGETENNEEKKNEILLESKEDKKEKIVEDDFSKVQVDDLKESPKKKKAVEEKKHEETKGESPEKPKSDVVEHHFQHKGEHNPTQKKAIDDAVKTLKKVVGYLYPLFSLMMSKKIENPEQFKGWGIDTDAKFFTLYIQNKMQTKNSQRREAFENHKHMDPWTQSTEYIHSLREKTIKDEVNTRIAECVAAASRSHGEEKANVFSNSDNLHEAAGALMGTSIGSGMINAFVKELCKGTAVMIREKQKMLTTGHYLGVRLYSDMKNWNIGKKKRNRLERAYPGIVFWY